MNTLVFIEPNRIDAEPFTTSKVIADMTGIGHRHIKRQIKQREVELLKFGLLVACATESSGGRPEEIIRLNEQQVTLLITFLKNTNVVVAFKVELVRQFYAMREELMRRHVERAGLKPIRREMTDMIKETTDNKWAYKQYTDLAYKMALGKTASKIREERGVSKKAKAIDYMTSEEIHAISKMQDRITVFLEMGMKYQEIKATLSAYSLVARAS